MLNSSELMWTEIGASFCWLVVAGLVSLYLMNRSRMGTRGFSAMPLVVFGGVFSTIAALLTAHANRQGADDVRRGPAVDVLHAPGLPRGRGRHLARLVQHARPGQG